MYILRDGNRLAMQYQTTAAFLADVPGVGGQAVADVNHCVQLDSLVQRQRFPDARCEVEMMTEDASSQWSRHESKVARLGAAPQNRAASRRAAVQRHADHQRAVPAVRVAADDGDVEGIGH